MKKMMKKSVKIIVDDIREAPFDYLLFKNPEEFIEWKMKNNDLKISILSLDHDMGLDFSDGYDLVKEMVNSDEINIDVIKKITFHTDNMIGLKNMYAYLINAQKNDAISKDITIVKDKMNLIDGRLSFSGYSFS